MSISNLDNNTNPIIKEMQAALNENTGQDSTQDLPDKLTPNDIWEKTYGDMFDKVSQSSIGDIPDDLGEYTRLGVQYNPYQPDISASQRAKNQPFGEQLANAGKRFLASTAIETINTAGSILAVDDYINADSEVGNAITNWAERQRGNLDKAAPIYIRDEKNSPNNYAWWLKNGASLAASVTSFGITGGLIGRGLSSIKWLSSLTKGYKGAKRLDDAAICCFRFSIRSR
jgi:hypothetical protein